MSSDSEEYVHDPGEFQSDADESVSRSGDQRAGDQQPEDSRTDGQEFGTRGWVLVGAIVVSFFVVPIGILYRPPQVPFEVAFLVLPLLPAFLLGATAVWTLAGRS